MTKQTTKTVAESIVIQPSWDRARDLLGKVRQSLNDWIALGDEISALQQQFNAQGDGGGNFSRTYSGPGISSGKGCEYQKNPMFSNSSARGISSRKGWTEKVEAELKISFQTAYRIMEKAQYLRNLKALADGNPVSWVDSDGEPKTITPSDNRKLLAATALERVIDGEVNAVRAWVGVVGEGDRQDRSPDGHRADANYGKLMIKTAPTLKNVFSHWGTIHLEAADREKVLTLFGEAMVHMPPELKHVTISAIKEWPAHDKAALIKALK